MNEGFEGLWAKIPVELHYGVCAIALAAYANLA